MPVPPNSPQNAVLGSLSNGQMPTIRRSLDIVSVLSRSIHLESSSRHFGLAQVFASEALTGSAASILVYWTAVFVSKD
jgi:hypothetical protein